MPRNAVMGPMVERADMRSFALGRRLEVITRLFSSIGYLLSAADLNTAVANMAGTPQPVRVLIIEPWTHSDAWRADRRIAEATNAHGIAVSRVSVNG